MFPRMFDDTRIPRDDLEILGCCLTPLLEDIPQMLLICIDIQVSGGTLSSAAASSYFASLIHLILADLAFPKEARYSHQGKAEPYGMTVGFKIIPPLLGLYWAMYWTVPVYYFFLSLPVFMMCLFLLLNIAWACVKPD